MNAEDTTHATEHAPKPKAKKRRVKRAAPKREAGAPKQKTDDRYAGMTVRDCCAACTAAVCVISGKPYCGHPRKGGLHPNEQNDSGALARRKEAEARLRNQVLSAQ